MEKTLILVMEEDVAYGEALSMYLNERHREITAYHGTLKDYEKYAASGQQFDILLMNAESAENMEKKDRIANPLLGKHTFFLTGKITARAG